MAALMVMLVEGPAHVSQARRTLRRLGFSDADCEAVLGEVGEMFRQRSLPPGATEDADLVAIAVMTAWETRTYRPDARGGLLRLRVRWAVRDALRQEARAHGWDRYHHRRPGLAGWRPIRRCACGRTILLDKTQARWCGACARYRINVLGSRAYRARQKQTAA